MAITEWTPLNLLATLPVPSAGNPVKVDALWMVVLDEFGAGSHLRITVDGKWVAMPGLPPCGPDGLVGLAFPDDRLLLTESAVGALIGRIGGGSATAKFLDPLDATSGQSKPFGVGTHCIVRLPAKAVGPLFLGFNILARPVSVETLRVTVEIAQPILG